MELLDLQVEFNETDNQGNHGQLWISDKLHAKVNLLSDCKDIVKDQLTIWIRRALLSTLKHRCERNEEGTFLRNGRKDMASIEEHVDLGSTLANFSETKGEFPYKKDQMLSNSLKSIVAGSVQFGDRLHAANLIPSDECTCKECNKQRHTAYHVFWECERHKTVRDKYVKERKKTT